MLKVEFRSRWSMLVIVLAILGMVTLWRLEPRVGGLWLNTAYLAAGACFVALPLGTLAAILIFKTDAPGRVSALLLFVGMLFVPLYLVTGAWDAGFGIQGWYTLATNPHLAHEPWLQGWSAAIWIHGLAAVPWVVLFVGSGLRAVEAEIEEDAATCAMPWQVLWHVTLRRAAPALVVAALWVAIVAGAEISVTDFFQVRTFAEEVYTQAALGTFDFPEAPTAEESLSSLPATGLWLGLLISTTLALLAILAAGRLFADVVHAPHRSPWLWRLSKLRWPAAILLWSILLLVAGVPLVNLANKAGIQVTVTDTGRTRSWSLAKTMERIAAAPVEFRGELWLSGRIGICAATAAVAVGIPLAWSLRFARRMPWIRLTLLALCLTIPGPLLGIAITGLLNQPPDSPFGFLGRLYDTNFAPWLVQTIRALPLATLILWPALASIPQAMLDTAATEGSGRWSQLLRIALPQRWPAVAAAWLVALAIAVGELAATILVMPPQRGATALSIRIFQMLHWGVDDRVAALCLVTAAATVALTAIAAVLLRRSSKKRLTE